MVKESNGQKKQKVITVSTVKGGGNSILFIIDSIFPCLLNLRLSTLIFVNLTPSNEKYLWFWLFKNDIGFVVDNYIFSHKL